MDYSEIYFAPSWKKPMNNFLNEFLLCFTSLFSSPKSNYSIRKSQNNTHIQKTEHSNAYRSDINRLTDSFTPAMMLREKYIDTNVITNNNNNKSFINTLYANITAQRPTAKRASVKTNRTLIQQKTK